MAVHQEKDAELLETAFLTMTVLSYQMKVMNVVLEDIRLYQAPGFRGRPQSADG